MENVIEIWKTRISNAEIQKEEKNLQYTNDVIQKSWSDEVKCYENGSRQPPQDTITTSTTSTAGGVAAAEGKGDRNNNNTTSASNQPSFNPRIFPYHKCCYLLLDMYLCVEGEFPYKVPFYVEEFARRNDDIVLEDEGYLPNSAYSVWASLVPMYRAQEYYLNFVSEVHELEERLLLGGGERHGGDGSGGGGSSRENTTIWISSSNNVLASDFSFLSSWSLELSKETKSWFTCDHYGKEQDLQQQQQQHQQVQSSMQTLNINEQDFRKNYFHGLPSMGSLPRGMRTKVLLKLLKHSMSEIQRDHRLARAILLALMEYQCLDGSDGAEAFRYFLLTVESEFIHDCDEDCQHGTNASDEDDSRSSRSSSSGAHVGHVCTDWQEFIKTLSKVLCWGIRTFTEQHALILCSFFRFLLDSTGWKEVEDLELLIGWNDDNYTMAKDTPFDLIRAILDGLSRLNYQYRCRVKNLLRIKYANEVVNVNVNDDLCAVVKSHIHCTRTLVSIGEMVLKSCKATPVTESIGSILVTALTLSSIFPLNDGYWYLENDIEGTYIGSMNGSGRSLIDVTRYSDCVTRASYLKEERIRLFKRQFGIHEKYKVQDDAIVTYLFLTPLVSVQNVVRGLYMRQLVESNEAGCGYGDFVVWSGGTITPFEPLLFEHNMNYPNKTGYDENKLQDERGRDLNVGQIRALYDLSLLMLRNAWTLPWTSASHDSFSTPFKKTIHTIALIAHRYNFPLELCVQINSFISREWWPRDDIKCWRYECQIDELGQYLQNQIEKEELEGGQQTSSLRPLVRCNGCRIAHACSKKHLKDVFHDGHRRLCRCPPFRVPTAEDQEICQQYLMMESNDDGNGQNPKRHDFVVGHLHQTGANYDNIENNENHYGEDLEADNDDDWESVESESDSSNIDSRVDMVVRYFENKAYRIQRIEDHAFANYYME